MADLNVQPKQKKSWLPWLLLILAIILILFFLLKGCNNNDNKSGAGTTDSVSATNGAAAGGATDQGATGNTTDSTPATASTGVAWGDIDFNAPAATYDEITNKNISVRGGNNYAIYGLGENILFDEGKNTIRTDAAQNLQQIAGSINKRFKGSSVRIYGFTDSIGSQAANKDLAAQRADAVRNWLVQNGKIPQDNISLQAEGESHPVASNASAQGRQQNRRVEIVARKPQNVQ